MTMTPTKREQENDNRGFSRLIQRAYIRDGHNTHFGEALLLACMLHVKGQNRAGDDMVDVRRIMKDHNL